MIKINTLKTKDGDEYEMLYHEIAKGVWEWDGSEPTAFEVDTNNDVVIDTRYENE